MENPGKDTTFCSSHWWLAWWFTGTETLSSQDKEGLLPSSVFIDHTH